MYVTRVRVEGRDGGRRTHEANQIWHLYYVEDPIRFSDIVLWEPLRVWTILFLFVLFCFLWSSIVFYHGPGRCILNIRHGEDPSIYGHLKSWVIWTVVMNHGSIKNKGVFSHHQWPEKGTGWKTAVSNLFVFAMLPVCVLRQKKTRTGSTVFTHDSSHCSSLFRTFVKLK